MKIAFATLFDLNNINRGSGTYHTICNNLNDMGHKVYKIQPVNIKFPFLTKFFRFISKRIFGMRYRSYQDPFVAKVIGNEVKKLIKDLDYDILLTNDYSIAGYTDSDKPIILWISRGTTSLVQVNSLWDIWTTRTINGLGYEYPGENTPSPG